MSESHYRICPLCEACCGLEVKTEGPKVIAIRGAANDVFSHGYLCPKGVSLKDLHEDPDRLHAADQARRQVCRGELGRGLRRD